MLKLTATGNVGTEMKTHEKEGKRSYTTSFAVSTGKDLTEWFNLYFAERYTNLVPHLTKGSKLLVVGKPVTSVYEGKASTTIFVDDVELLFSKKEQGEKLINSEDQNTPF